MMTELLPCSHCGGEAELLTFWDFYKFSCKNADCTAHVADAPYVQHAEGVWYGSIDEARAAWNTRAERTCKPIGTIRYDYEGGYAGFEYETELSCGHMWRDSYGDYPDYCPNCGAKVVGE